MREEEGEGEEEEKRRHCQSDISLRLLHHTQSPQGDIAEVGTYLVAIPLLLLGVELRLGWPAAFDQPEAGSNPRSGGCDGVTGQIR